MEEDDPAAQLNVNADATDVKLPTTFTKNDVYAEIAWNALREAMKADSLTNDDALTALKRAEAAVASIRNPDLMPLDSRSRYFLSKGSVMFYKWVSDGANDMDRLAQIRVVLMVRRTPRYCINVI